MSDKTATLIVDSKEFELPVHQGTLGPDVISVAKLAPSFSPTIQDLFQQHPVNQKLLI